MSTRVIHPFSRSILALLDLLRVEIRLAHKREAAGSRDDAGCGAGRWLP